ncbi:sigma-70 family RNA polymerase sigma factor [Nitrincola sp. A-D6]|uniref:sigma-70 family RNA polymerase sigma factor n=1 Tax=Nitrincola sp. A-D6 TaxID=1545442 RepID=UPI0006905A6C|nr:sigma-70 family RNA polymerase sigma factor [Nitrincola sp. A-D6]
MADSDEMLLKQIARGDEEALAVFYRRYESRLFNFIQTKLHDAFEAADILNEVFLEVWHKAGSFQGRSKVSTWLFSIAYYKVVDRLRKIRPKQLEDEAMAEIADESPAVLSCLIGGEQAEQIRHCIQTLSIDHRAVMDLTFFEEMSYSDIAMVVGCPENTVKTRMFHAKQVMKKCLSRLIGGFTMMAKLDARSYCHII